MRYEIAYVEVAEREEGKEGDEKGQMGKRRNERRRWVVESSSLGAGAEERTPVQCSECLSTLDADTYHQPDPDPDGTDTRSQLNLRMGRYCREKKACAEAETRLSLGRLPPSKWEVRAVPWTVVVLGICQVSVMRRMAGF